MKLLHLNSVLLKTRRLYKTIFFWKLLGKRQRKVLIVFALVILLITLPLLRDFLSPRGAEAAWFDDNWGYRQAIPVTSTEGSAQTNVFLSFTLDTATPIAAGKMQSSCQDLRITDANGKLLKYHIGRVTACNNAATTIDFLLPSFPDGKSTYYVYYGNSTAPSADAGSLTVSAASAATVTTSGNEITDVTRAAQVQGDGLYPSATNLVTNGGAETNATGWSNWSNNTGTARSTAQAKFGAASITFHNDDTVDQFVGVFAPFTPTNGVQYSASWWIMSPITTTLTPRVSDGSGNWSANGTAVAVTAGVWTKMEVDGFTPASNSGPIILRFNGSVATTSYWFFDGAQVETGSAATAYIETDGATASRYPDSSYGIWQAATNLITNGGFETNTNGWSTDGTNTVTKSAIQAKFGAASLKATYQSDVRLITLSASGFSGLAAGSNTVSTWVYVPSTYTGTNLVIYFTTFTGATGNVSSGTGAPVNMALTNQWQKVSATAVIDAGDLVGNVVIRENGTVPTAGDFIYIDGAQLETGSIATPYIETDGGTASRAAGRIQPNSSVLNATQGWIAFRAKPGWATSAIPASGTRLFMWFDGTSNNVFELSFTTNELDFRRRDISGDNYLPNAVSLSANTNNTYIAKWTATQIGSSVNGASFTTQANTKLPTGLPSTFDIGSQPATTLQFDGNILWAVAGTGTITDADASTINGYGNTDPTTVQLAALNSGLANSTFLWTADTAADTQTAFSQGTARNYTIGTLATEEKGPGPISYWSLDDGNGPTAKNSNWKKTGTTTNLVINPSFETNTTSWSAVATGTITQVTAASEFGAKSLEVDILAAGDAARISGSGNVTQGVTYTVSGWVKAKSAADVGKVVQPIIQSSGGSFEIFGNTPITLTTSWHRETITFTWANSGHTNWTIDFRSDRPQGAYNFYLDGVQYEQASAATSYCDGSLVAQGAHSWAGMAHASTSTCDYGTNLELNSTTWQNNDMCLSGKCLAFDGTNSYAKSSDANLPSGANPFSVSLWVRPNGFAAANYGTPFSYGTAAFLQGLLISENGDTGDGTIIIGRYGSNILTTTKALTNNQWNHVEVTYDGTTLTAYVNGIAAGTTNVTLTTTLNSLHIGDSMDGTQRLKGFVDEVKVYNFSRTIAQVQQDFAGRGSGKGSSAVLGTKDQSFLSNGLAGYWKMDEATWSGTLNEVVDSSGNTNHGTAKGGTNAKAYPTAGNFGNGGFFDGVDDYIAAGTTLGNSYTAITASAWIYPTSTNVGTVITKNGPFYLAYGNSQSPQTQHVGAGIFNGTSWTWLNGGTTIPTNQWSHITMTYDGTTIKVYLNGSQDGSVADTGTLGSTSAEVRIGYGTPGYDQFFAGKIDEVRVYSRALSPAEVSNLYNFAPGPVANWDFNENQGTNVNDITGNANTGTWNGTLGSQWSQGKYGSAGKFNGTDNFVSTGVTSPTSGFGSITVSLWVKPSTNTSRAFIGDYDNGAGQHGWLFYNPSSANMLRLIIQAGSNKVIDLTDSSIFDGNWHYLSFTYDGSNVLVYTDGNQRSTTPLTGTLVASGTTLLMGKLSDNSYYMNGRMDDARIYNYARTQKQIVEDMNGGHPAGGSPVGSQVGYWKFDEGYGTNANNSGNAGSTLNGIMHNFSSPATAVSGWTNSGRFYKALMFDGSNDTTLNYISISEPSTSPLNITGDVTISAWIKPAPSAFDISGGQIVRSGQFSNEVYGVSYVPNLQRIDFDWYDGTFKGNSSTTNSVPIGQWSHVVAARTGSTLNIYINGVLNATSTVTTPTVAANDSFTIGGSTSPAVHQSFHGAIDEVKIYNYGMTTSEVALDYNHGASMVLGAFSDTSGLTGGANASNSASALYCVPGDTSTCSAPVGQWSFDENQGTSVNDITGNGNLGSWNGTLGSQWKQGKYGSAANFTNSNQYVDVGNSSTLNPPSTMTIEFWAYPTSIPVSEQVAVSRYFTSGDATTDYLVEAQSAGTWRFLVQQSNLTLTGISAGTVTLNAWNHVVAVADGTKLRLYVNGVSVGTPVSYDGTINTSTRNTIIGRTRTEDPNGPFKGIIDDVKIFNYARTPTQAAWDYNRGGPVGWWKFDECQGANLNDYSGNGNSATLTVGATGSQTVAGTCLTPTDGTGAWYNGVAGKRNYSLNFDGTDDYVNVPDVASINFSGDFTVGAWVKTSVVNSAYHHILQKGNSGDTCPDYQLMLNTDNKFRFTVEAGAGCSPTSSVLSLATAQTGTWYYVVGVRQNGISKLYVNGVLQNTGGTTVSGDLTSTTPLTIGAQRRSTGVLQNFWNGQIDDARIYNYALTTPQIQTLYNNGAVFFGPVTGAP